MSAPEPLSSEALLRHCRPEQFEFESTRDLDAFPEIVGQARAVAAVRFGVGIRQSGYNLFALGPQGVGKYTAVEQHLQREAAEEQPPDDWCYVYDFDQPYRPQALQLPPGVGRQFRQDMKRLVDELRALIPAAFEGEDYQTRRQAVGEEFQQKQEDALEALSEKARDQGIALLRTPNGLAFAPLREGEVLAPDEYRDLPEDEKEKIQAQIESLQAELQRIVRQLPQWNRQGREAIKELDQEIAAVTLTPIIDEVQNKYEAYTPIVHYLDGVQQDMLSNLDMFRATQEQIMQRLAAQQGQSDGDMAGPESAAVARDGFFNRYEVNVLVDNSATSGAPVIYEDNPTQPNLIGRVEHRARMGMLMTDFTLIKPGALHRANGGYLMLDARKVLLQPLAWEHLKRSLQAGEINIESPAQAYSLISTVSLEPQPIPLRVKVVLLGERMLYYLLYQADPDFGELFKVAADFEDDMERHQENNQAYARVLGKLTEKYKLRPLRREAVARIIEHSSRLAGDARKLTTHMQEIADLLRESDYWAGQRDSQFVEADDVQTAIDAQVYRRGRIRERMQEAIMRESILIDTDGERVGQINGLSVLEIGGHRFGRPSRITAAVRLGKGEVIDIERQVEMGGPIHSKGVMILSGFLGSRFAAERPLSLSASLVFEQSYSGVDGDSASSAELYALLSALAQVPIRQNLAVTGSVNQHGMVQAIGGVNEKIEGFFDICRQRGLAGDQGVLIPAANVQNLMLRQDVVDAAARGDFHIFAVETVDQGIELLTGVPAGVPDESGAYPEGSVNHRVAHRLQELAQKQREYSRPPAGAASAE